MAWRETCPLDERVQFIGEHLAGSVSMTVLCRTFGISRKTGYKWISRYNTGGVSALDDRARAPRSHPNAASAEVVREILAAKKRYRFWGPRKLLLFLEEKDARRAWPSASTMGEILKRHGMVKRRRKKRTTPPFTEPFAACDQPNAVWCVDFKGHFAMGNGMRCHPLTLTDAYSRYLLGCKGLRGETEALSRPVLESAFREFGLPERLRSDNGRPFASVGLGGLSVLGVWLLKLGITPERIEPGKPQQNGRHERMHRTLKEATTKPPKEDLKKQQQAFDRFRSEYNDERPHEALGQRPPATHYKPSARHFPARVAAPEYAEGLEKRLVDANGSMKWRGHRLHVTDALRHEVVGLEEVDDGVFDLRFGPLVLAKLIDDPKEPTLIPLTGRWARVKHVQGA